MSKKLISSLWSWAKRHALRIIPILMFLAWLVVILCIRYKTEAGSVCFWVLATILIVLTLGFVMFFYIEEKIFWAEWFTEAYYDHKLRLIERKVQIVTGNASARLTNEHVAFVRRSLIPKRENITLFASTIGSLFVTLSSIVLSVKIDSLKPLTSVLSPYFSFLTMLGVILIPLVIVMLSAYAYKLETDENAIIDEIYMSYVKS